LALRQPVTVDDMGSLMLRRRARTWTAHSFAAFGVVALVLQSYQAVWNRGILPGHELAVASAAVGAALLYGFFRSRPPRAVRRTLQYPQCVVEIRPGDLFAEDDFHLVIGFSDMRPPTPAMTDSSDPPVSRANSSIGVRRGP
jgi:hypothetical protein